MEFYKEFLVFPFENRKKIAFLAINGSLKSWTFEVDWNFSLSNGKPRMFLENGNEEVEKKIPEQDQPDQAIQHLAVSEAHNLLAFTASDKSVYLCKISDSSAVILSRRIYLRSAGIIKISSSGKYLFLADKTGDVFEYSCEDAKAPGRWISGHISQILDLQVNANTSYIATSDRDEKIRVTNYPATHDVESYCIGHKEYVSSLAFLSDDEILVSASGDKTLRFWNPTNGQQLQLVNLDFVPITIAVSEKEKGEGLMAISSDDNTLYIYNYHTIDLKAIKINLLAQKLYPGDFEIVAHDTFYMKYLHEIDDKTKLKLDKFSVADKSFDLHCDIAAKLDIEAESCKTFKPFDVSLLFKKRYDNVKPYIDKKRARIESQQSKKK